MAEMSYREKVDAKRIQDIRKNLNELPDACADFINAIVVTTSTFTRLAYTVDLCTFFHFLQTERRAFADKPLYSFTDQDLAAVKQNDLTSFIDYLTLYYKSGNDEKPFINHELSIKRKLCSIRAFYDYLYQNQRIPANVTQLVPLPKIHEKPIIRLDRDEMEKILTIAETGEKMSKREQAYQKRTAKRDYALLSLFLGTGIRVSECVGLNLSDIDMEQNAFIVTRKGGNQVVLYFPPEVADALAEYMEERSGIETLPGHEDALFLSLQKRRITQRAVQNLVKKYASYAAPLKTRISPHKLRSTFATNLYQDTGDIYLVADVLGHSSVDTTRKHYADMTDQRRRSAAMHVHMPPRKDAEPEQTVAIPQDEDS